MDRGYIPLFRMIRDNKLWQKKPFDKCRAWIDILFRMNNTGNKIEFMAANVTYTVEPGEFNVSRATLQHDWGWTERVLKDYLTMLYCEDMLKKVPKKGPKNSSFYSVVNHHNYKTWMDEKVQKKVQRRSNEGPDKILIREIIEEDTMSNSKIPFHEIFDLWNKHCPFSKVNKLTKKRKEKISVRWEEWKTIEQVTEIFERLGKSLFCQGKNDRGWRATFDWILYRTDNSIKTLEGIYDNRKENKKETKQEAMDRKMREQFPE